MSAAVELIQAVKANGGQIRVEGDCLVIAPGEAAAPVMDELRQHKAEIIGLLESGSIQPDDPVEGPIDEGWGEWLLEQCAFRDRWWSGTGALYLSLARWCASHGRPAPASRAAFVTALQGEGFQVRRDGSDVLVVGLVLKADLEAFERFQTAPTPAQPTVHARRTRRQQ
jgi:hypothetical protein